MVIPSDLPYGGRKSGNAVGFVSKPASAVAITRDLAAGIQPGASVVATAFALAAPGRGVAEKRDRVHLWRLRVSEPAALVARGNEAAAWYAEPMDSPSGKECSS